MRVKVQHPFDPGVESAAWRFTFGYLQRHPKTGEALESRFVTIRGTFDEARAEMVRRFGTKWAGQYASDEDAGVERFGLRPLEGEEAFGGVSG